MVSVVALPDATVSVSPEANVVFVLYAFDLTDQVTDEIVAVPKKRDQSTL